mgnify:FL=1
MTRTYAAQRLIEHGPLTFREFAEITGWPVSCCRTVWRYLLDKKASRLVNDSGKRKQVAA